ncbi:hypothetical protein D3C80_735380 [compost metagenome]
MFAQILPGGGNIFFPFAWQAEVHLDKVAQIKAGLFMLHPVIRQDHQGIAFWYRVGKGFLIRE